MSQLMTKLSEAYTSHLACIHLIGDFKESATKPMTVVESSWLIRVSMQAKYHQERFRTYPHVDSPAKLIQELLKPGGTMTVLPK